MIKRPIIRYLGGKWRLAPWIISHFPPHVGFTEVFGGAYSVTLRKAPSKVEVYNDLDGEMVNLFRVLRSPSATQELVRLLHLTPYARQEFTECYELSDDPIEQARRTIVLATMSFSPADALKRQVAGFRVSAAGSHHLPAELTNLANNLPAVTARLKNIVIENRPAIEVLQQYDRTTTLHYVDPPYVWDTRGRRARYNHELTTIEDHQELLTQLTELQGMVILSGYDHPSYHLPGWKRSTKLANTNSGIAGNSLREEVLWINPAAQARDINLFEQ